MDSPPCPAPVPRLQSLPVELLTQICRNLPPLDLLSLSLVSRVFSPFISDDSYWRCAIDACLPHPITSPHPFNSYKRLYISRFPCWFLLQRRFWFADLGSTGKLIVTRFNRATGGIEAYNVVVPRINVAANGSVNGGVLAWEGREGEGWVLRSYMPDLQLWYNDPVLVIDSEVTSASLKTFQARSDAGLSQPAAPEQPRWLDRRRGKKSETIPWRGRGITMEIASQPAVRNILRLAHRVDHWSQMKADDNGSHDESLPVWPPKTIHIPPAQRVCSTPPDAAPRTTSSISTYGFHLSRSMNFAPRTAIFDSVGVGVEVGATYATLDEEMYTPRPSTPLQGIWIGDYSGHGSEFLLFAHRDTHDTAQGIPHSEDTDNNPRRCSNFSSTNDDPDRFSSDHLNIPSTASTTARTATPTSSPPRSRSSPVSISPASPSLHIPSTLPPIQLPSHGSLHAVKITGDPNVPRGELSFMIPDLSPATGLIRIATESPFNGAPVFRGKGHIARQGFTDCECVDVEVILVSVNVVAVVWIDMKVVAYFRRVDVRELWER